MLNKLAKKDKLWRQIACKICGDKFLADDLVNEMYLRRFDNDRGQPTTDYYIVCTMKSIYLNMKQTNKLIAVADLAGPDVEQEAFEPDDKQQELIDKANRLPYTKRELLELNYDNSLRDIEKKFGVNYTYCHRHINEARKQILGDEIHLYKNKRLKHLKQSKN